MFRYSVVFFCVVLLSNVEFIQAGKFSGGGGSRQRHSYPKSPGLSGGNHYSHTSGGSHNYPPSPGLSGNSGSSGGYSGGGGHTYQNSGANSGNHKYPSSPGLSGTNNYGTAGRGNQGTTNVHHHYHYNYNPPQQIRYASPHGGPAVSYPVFRGSPPTYVYQYKNSGSKYGTLLAGLALFNLGALAGGAIGYSQGHSNNNHGYKADPNELCLFGVKKDNGDFEETRIDCVLTTSFRAEQSKPNNSQSPTTTNTTVTTVTNETTIITGNAQNTTDYVLSPNGTLVPSNTTNAGNSTSAAPAADGTVTKTVVVTSTTTNTTVNAVDVKGPPIQVTPGMQCYVIRKTPYSRMKHEVPCGLLQTYADRSLKRNSAARNVPAFTILAVLCAMVVNNY